jgi:hypothetical protein
MTFNVGYTPFSTSLSGCDLVFVIALESSCNIDTCFKVIPSLCQSMSCILHFRNAGCDSWR